MLFGYDFHSQTDKYVVAKYRSASNFPINVFNPVYGLGIPSLDQIPDNGPFGSSRSWHGLYMQDQVKFALQPACARGRSGTMMPCRGTVLNEDRQEDHRLSPRVSLVWQPMAALAVWELHGGTSDSRMLASMQAGSRCLLKRPSNLGGRQTEFLTVAWENDRPISI
ncbi:MAG: hypothetical protein MRJ92_02785 [Nitrospira sp.]|nr:hypothetical protein [Nitrospira sp.]